MSLAADTVAVDAGRHDVHFYADERELAASVGGRLADVLQAGGAAIIIATSEHRQAFDAELRQAGLDPDPLRAAGVLLTLDAEQTMRGFIVEGRPDAPRFDRVVGGLLRTAVAVGRPLWIYGEMVSLLWDAGLVGAAIELEELWNELARELPFTLLCGYRAQALGEEEHAGSLRAVCRAHGHVIASDAVAADVARYREPSLAPDGATASRSFACDTRSPGGARRFVTETLEVLGADELVDDATILVTELGTNAVVHAGSGFVVTIAITDDSLRITVSDHRVGGRSGRRVRLVPRPGRGLGIVAALASSWGAERSADGTTVWAELSR